MKKEMTVLYAGAIGLILSASVFFEGPLHDQWAGNPEVLNSLMILYGFPFLLGSSLLFLKREQFENNSDRTMVMAHAAAVVGLIWLVLVWCFGLWLSQIMMADNADMNVRHTADLHMFGVGFALAGYMAGWLVREKGLRALRFLMSAAWSASYMALFNLLLPVLTGSRSADGLALKGLWFSGIGGLLVVLGAFLISRNLRKAVEPATRLP